MNGRFRNNPVPKVDERTLPTVMFRDDIKKKDPSRQEKTTINVRIDDLRRQAAERAQNKDKDIESRRKKLQLIIGGTLAAIAAAAGTVLVVKNTGDISNNAPAAPASATSLPVPDDELPPMVLVTTAPTSEPSSEPSVNPSEVAVAPSSSPAQPAPRQPVVRRDSIYDEMEDQSIYDEIDKKYSTKAPQPKPKPSGGIIRKAPF